MITAKDLHKTYNNGLTRALDGVSLDIPDGCSAVVLGASGSGKSTLLNVLSGLERADSGSVVTCGCELGGMSDKELTDFRKRYVGFVFQQYCLLPHLDVEANVRLGADLAGNGNYKEIIEALGLADKRKVKPSKLSGGEQQRVCIARALAKLPQVLFLDEPTGALDEKTGRDVLDYILRLRRELGFTAVTVTHNANIADTADLVIKMNSGRIVESYKNERVCGAYEIDW